MTELATPPAPATANAVFGVELPRAVRYVEMLARQGVLRGVIGPREIGRLWERHILNSAAVAELVPRQSRVIDLGSGAGLPGVPVAIARPDLSMTLLEPMARRVAWLEEVVAELDLAVAVRRGRAEELDDGTSGIGADVVLARAVAPLHTLIGWALPLVRPGGRLLALKGRRAPEEVSRDAMAVRHAGGREPEIVRCGPGGEDDMATVVVVERAGRGGSVRRKRKDR